MSEKTRKLLAFLGHPCAQGPACKLPAKYAGDVNAKSDCKPALLLRSCEC